MDSETLTITDNRTRIRLIRSRFTDGTIRAMDLRQIKTGPDDFGLMTYDPAFMNTASCQSAITYLDGDKGILRYRGYPIEQLAEHCTFLEVAYLLLHGELPTSDELDVLELRGHAPHHDPREREEVHGRFPLRRAPHGHPASARWRRSPRSIRKPAMSHDPQVRRKQIVRLIGKMPTLAAYAYRHRLGLPYIYPDPELGYTKNYMNMLWKRTGAEVRGQPGAGARARGALHPARRPRAELQHQHHARRGQLRRRPLRHHGRRHRRALRPAARRRQRRSAAHAGRNRHPRTASPRSSSKSRTASAS